MNRKIFLKTILTFLLAFFAAGGACYPPAQSVSSEKMTAADVFTYYQIEEYIGDDGKCKRRITAQFSGENKVFQLKPPARATYNGADASGEFGCETDRAEFVLTDHQGGMKRDLYETKKAKLDFPAEIERARDLRVPVEFDDKYDYEIKGRIESKNGGAAVAQLKVIFLKNEAEFAERSSNPDIPENLSYVLRREKMLVIPKTILSPFASGDATVNVEVAQRIFKPKSENPESSLESMAFSYEYSLKAKLKLK